MKKILIVGANSYIGTSFDAYMAQWGEDYRVDTLDVITDAWKNTDFSCYDVLYHVAGIAHQKETEESAPLYYKVNRDLALEIAEKAKREGVGHFVFMSSMSVYGMERGEITPDTQPAPVTHYGRSKLEAEEGLKKLAAPDFRVAILRPPMVYGKNCRGNFQLMLKLVKKSPVFPGVWNQRSMISVRNLCAFVRMAIDRQLEGVFFPQNREYVNTTEMAKLMAKVLGRRVWFSRLVGLLVECLVPVVSVAGKAFGSLTYRNCEQFDFCYCEEAFAESVTDSI